VRKIGEKLEPTHAGCYEFCRGVSFSAGGAIGRAGSPSKGIRSS
jgi:hypothetical protein